MTFFRGDDVFWDIPLVYPESDDPDRTGPYPLAGCTVIVTAKPFRDSDVSDSEAAWQHSLTVAANGSVTASNGLTLGPDGASAGVVVEHLTAATSAGLEPGSYKYDVQVTDASGLVTTVASGTETVKGDITRGT